jgi:hypothetical protein
LLYENFFFENTLDSISRLEDFLTYPIPQQLKCFLIEIGWGQLQTGNNGNVSDNNNVASPDEIISILSGQSDWLMPYSQLSPDALPFFQRGIDLFLCLKPHSDNPNAVHLCGAT